MHMCAVRGRKPWPALNFEMIKFLEVLKLEKNAVID